MTLKKYICRLLDEGLDVEEAWTRAQHERWYAPWNYVAKIARDWKRDHAPSNS